MGVDEHLQQARVLNDEGDVHDALKEARFALELAHESGDKSEEALVYLAIADEFGGDGDAVGACEKAVALFHAADDKYAEASAMLSLGQHCLTAGFHDAALRAGRNAMDIYKKLQDTPGMVGALGVQMRTYVAMGDSEKAHRIAKEQRGRWATTGDCEGEAGIIELTLELQTEQEDWRGVNETAQASFEFFEAHGMIAGAAQMLLILARSKLALWQDPGNLDTAKDYAEKAGKMFSELEMYDNENQCQEVYRKAHARETCERYVVCNKTEFYKNVRLASIAYGPSYRALHVQSGRDSKATHLTCALQLAPTSSGEYEGWEVDVQYHPAQIDAGGHLGFAAPITRVPTTQEVEDFQRQGGGGNAAIPYMMVAGHFNGRKQPNTSPMWMNNYASRDEKTGEATFDTFFWQNN